jgi:hypothetical protein
MKASNSEINFYTDTMIVISLLSNNGLSKTAGLEEMASELIGKVKDYVGSKIEPDNKAGSVLNMLAPGALSLGLSAMGMPWLGLLFGAAYSIFNIDISGILSSIWNSLKSLIGGDKKTTSEAVDSVVSSAVQAHSKPATEEEAQAAAAKAQTQLPPTQSQLLREVRVVKLAMIEFERINLQSTKGESLQSTAGILDVFSSQKVTITSVLMKILSWIFKVALASAGLMVVGDLINKYVLGKPSGSDKEPAPAEVVSTQTKFKLQPNYKNIHSSGNWVMSIPNNEASIENMLISFAKQTYQGLDGLESTIRNTAGFQVISNNIISYNKASAGDPIVYIPKNFTSEKQITDHFIDEVAEKTP